MSGDGEFRNHARMLECLYNEHYGQLVLWADTILQDTDVAKDMVQEFFLRIWEKHLLVPLEESALKSYCYISIRNMALRKLKDKQRIQALDPSLIEEAWEEPDLEHEKMIEMLRQEIALLPQRSREVLECVHLKGMKYAEVASRLGISVATVKTLLVRSLKSLRDNIHGIILSR